MKLLAARLLLTLRTAVHLRPRQVAGRILRGVRGVLGLPALRRPPGAVGLHPRLPVLAGALALRLESAAFRSLVERAERLRNGTFEAVGESVPVDRIDWTGRPGSHLFTYHLHYFDDAPALAALARGGDVSAETRLVGLWEDWLGARGDGRGDAWAPYPLSARIPNWLQALALLDASGEADDDLGRRLRASLWTQADRLRRTLEHDLQGNHLLRNRTALVWAAAALDPPPLPLTDALEALTAEVGRQVLSDGMHEERTPGYHARVLYDVLRVLELLRALDIPAPPGLEEPARRMRGVLGRFVRAGDGGLHPLGDTTPHGDPRPAAVEHLAESLLGTPADSGVSGGVARPTSPPDTGTPEPWHLEEAGFSGLSGPDVEIVFDCGPFGARHQPGHGHCDGLSFVLSLGGTPLIVDPGVAGYAADPWRSWARGTAAHNTVQVDHRHQTEIWDTFRAARRARVGGTGVGREGEVVRLFGSLSPYHARRVVHEREVTIHRREVRAVEVRDRVRGARGRRLDTRLHFAEGATVRKVGERRWKVRCREEVVDLEATGLDGVRWDTGPLFPGWGTVREGPVLRGWIDPARRDVEAFGFRLCW